MKKVFCALVATILATLPAKSPALFGAGDTVYDPAAVAQLITQVQKTLTMINELQDLNTRLQGLQDWAKIDHTDLAGGKFSLFLDHYKELFDEVLQQVDDYQGGGLMGAIAALESRYPGYHEGWEEQDTTDDPFYENAPPGMAEKVRAMKKQLLLTKIQMKHALKVGAKVRSSLKDADTHTQTLLSDTGQAVGVMQTIKIGNELTGMVSRSLQSLNVQVNEYVQAYAAEKLEENARRGALANRAREALSNFGAPRETETPAPLNPIGKF